MGKAEAIENLMLQNEYECALEEIERLEEEQKKQPEILSCLGVIYAADGRFKEAEYYCLQALAKEPNNVDYLYNLAYIDCKLHNYKEADSIVKKIREISGDKDTEKTENPDLLDLEQEIRQGLDRQKNVLMLAYYFPPLSGSGVFRSLKFAKYLPNFDWIPTVISAETPPALWNFSDESLMQDYPSFIEVCRVGDEWGQCKDISVTKAEAEETLALLVTALQSDPQAYELFGKILNHPNGMQKLLVFPCLSLNWVKKALQYIEKNINLSDLDVIYTTSGPASSHLAGYYMKKKYGIPWVADFRDEWTGNPYANYDFQNNPLHLLLKYLENIVLKYADMNISATETGAEKWIQNFGINRQKIRTITNGYDEDDFQKLLFKKDKHEKFRIVYCGITYVNERSLLPFLKIINEMLSENVLERDKLSIGVMGTNSVDNTEEITRLGFENIIEILPFSKHEEALQFCSEADLLLSFHGSSEKFSGVYTGKIFEYLRQCKPILAFAPAKGIIADLLKKFDTGVAIPIEDNEEVKKYVLNLYRKWEVSDCITYSYNDGIEQFERKNLTGKLAEVFELVKSEKKNGEIEAQVYDAAYAKGGFNKNYFKHYTESVYYVSWKEVIKYLLLVERSKKILDIGCGVGQFANMLFDYGFHNYTGIDFSDCAIEMAKQSNPEHEKDFRCEDVFRTQVFDEGYDITIVFEILEHLKKDLELLARIKSGALILFSVPNFPDQNHVRFFNNKEQVNKRYSDAVDIYQIQEIALGGGNCLYLAVGKKR